MTTHEKNWFEDVLTSITNDISDPFAGDVQRARDEYEACPQGDSRDFAARSLVRAALAALEASVSFFGRVLAYVAGSAGQADPGELIVLVDEKAQVSSKGQVTTSYANRPLIGRTKAIARIACRLTGGDVGATIGGIPSGPLGDAQKIRNRLMHPDTAADAKVSSAEVEVVLKAYKETVKVLDDLITALTANEESWSKPKWGARDSAEPAGPDT